MGADFFLFFFCDDYVIFYLFFSHVNRFLLLRTSTPRVSLSSLSTSALTTCTMAGPEVRQEANKEKGAK